MTALGAEVLATDTYLKTLPPVHIYTHVNHFELHQFGCQVGFKLEPQRIARLPASPLKSILLGTSHPLTPSDTNCTTFNMSGLIALQSKQHLQLLDEIDKLRAVGLQEIVSLPQLVVCGDQSSGKSSVLEAITEVPFPRKETLCTRFATEIVLRRAATQKVAVSIVPDASRPMVEADALRRFDGKLKDLDDLPRVAEEATQAMGINQSGNAFSKDVLSIEISGPDRPQLTLVDLPGLIHSENKAQTTHDVELVWQLVSSYIENKRTIILAVVTAKNDYANQIILKRAREVDRDGNRTLGIITKPDTLHPGSESEAEFVDLAQNEDSVVQFRLGWHILKNRSYEVKDCSFSERNRSESSFFDEGAWSKLSKDVVGVDSLRRRLSALLLDHIRSELPSVCREVKEKLLKCEKDLKSMGDERSSSRDQGIFLSRLGQRFSELCKAAVDGLYEDAFFGNTSAHPGNDKRLRAAVQNANMTFATHMRLKGHTREVVRSGTEESVLSQTQQNDMPLRVTEAWAVARIQSILEQNRGRELPGTFNPTIIHTLFLEQSERWGSEARKHVKHVWAKCTSLVQLIVAEIANKRIGDRLMHYRINDILKKRLRDAEDELEEILRDRKRHAITYNHYYIDNVQKIHEQRRAKSSERALRKALGLTDESKLDMSKPLNISPQQLLTAMSTETEADMDRFACIEILDCMLAYYEVCNPINSATLCPKVEILYR